MALSDASDAMLPAGMSRPEVEQTRVAPDPMWKE
jgi:hypothetical protein